MYVYIYICICVYIYIHTCVYTCTHTHIHSCHYILWYFPVFIDEFLAFRDLRRAVWRASVRPMGHLGTSDGQDGRETSGFTCIYT